MSNGAVVMRIVMENEGLWVSMSFPSSTIGTRWLIPGDGYKTMVFSIGRLERD